ncbi:uncharacterized protein LOC126611926 [Malus sylvestris]|uniref:uncharacterized protein LOC126611926 n=1 Tax=Malus sylvestris TaxID=3752 RepID=UPI0021ACFA5D|nr:uncharacterized protein LOC126611926 [Malus sylvestris]
MDSPTDSPIPSSVMKIWDQWNLRGIIILSLSLQTFLILFAPLRKRTSNKLMLMPIWLAYLLADWAASCAVGLISSRQSDTQNHGDYGDLLAFWAPFLLLHLGGPYTIIAIALEDNALWPRHLLGLLFQAIAALYIFVQSLPRNKLWIPTLLLFLAGIIKYVECTRALYLASVDGLKEVMLRKPEPGWDYAKFMEEYSSKKDANLPIEIHVTEHSIMDKPNAYRLGRDEMDDNVAVVRHAYHFFQIFKALIIGLKLSFYERKESRAIFLERTSQEALDLVTAELNFMYESFYTKVAVVHSKLGYIFRAISFCAVSVALFFFYKLEKHDFQRFDIVITYTLLYGAIGLDLMAVFILVFSDWTTVAMSNPWRDSVLGTILGAYLNFKRTRCPKKATSCLERTRRFLFRRWSESVSTFNLIDYSLKECTKVRPTVIDLLGLKGLREKMKYVFHKPFTMGLWDFIFEELKYKSILAKDPQASKKLFSARGDWILQDNELCGERNELLPFVDDFNYAQSLLLWHIATDLCDTLDKSNAEDRGCREYKADDHGCREYSKTMPGYMLYLLVMQTTMMSSVAGVAQIELLDTCAEAKSFFSKRKLGPGKHEEACNRFLKVNTEFKPVFVRGRKSKSVWFDACILAKELMKLEEKKWEIISKVWVELLSYTATHCRAHNHAEFLGQGGELVTFVWLLLSHFGIWEQFVVEEELTGKLIVGK